MIICRITVLCGTGCIGSCCRLDETAGAGELFVLLFTGGALKVACKIDAVGILLAAFIDDIGVEAGILGGCVPSLKGSVEL